MKTLNELIEGYTGLLHEGEIQLAYRGILAFLGKLRAVFKNNYPHYEISSVYQGYMDMSYFSINPKFLKDRGLKIAIVYLHGKGVFEAWLSARNREIAKNYQSMLRTNNAGNINLFHDDNNPDAILECVLTRTPSFEDQDLLIETIDQAVEQFIETISVQLSLGS